MIRNDTGLDQDCDTDPITSSPTSSTHNSPISSHTGFSTSSGSDDDRSSDSDADASLDSENDHDSEPEDDSISNASSSSEGEAESETTRIQAWQEIASTIAGAQKRQIRHDAAEVAMSSTPFLDLDELQAYTLALAQSMRSDEYPAGFGLNEEYESIESYKTGRSSKPLTIPLPHGIWFPRIVVWCKAVDLLKRLSICREATVSPP